MQQVDDDNKEGIEVEMDDQHKLFKFAKQGDSKRIKELHQLNKQININMADNGKEGDREGNGRVYGTKDTPLHFAAASGSVETCDLLFKLEARMDLKNKLGSTPLIVAAAYGHLDVVKFLLDKKADINATNNIGNTALHCAVYAGHIPVVEKLLDAHKHDGKEPAKQIAHVNGVGLNCWDYATQTSNSQMRSFLEQIVHKYTQNKSNQNDDDDDDNDNNDMNDKNTDDGIDTYS